MYLLSLICTVTATPLGHPPFHQNLRSNRPKIQQLCIKTITALLLQAILTQLIPFTTDLKISVIYYIQKTHTQIRSLCHCFKKENFAKDSPWDQLGQAHQHVQHLQGVHEVQMHRWHHGHRAYPMRRRQRGPREMRGKLHLITECWLYFDVEDKVVFGYSSV